VEIQWKYNGNTMEIQWKYNGNTMEINRAGQPAAGRLGEITVSILIKFKITGWKYNGNTVEIN
jgi:hypothetical protein